MGVAEHLAWIAVPLALAVAAAAPAVRAGALGGALVLAAALAAAAPAVAPTAAGAASLAVLCATRARLERERDAMRRHALHDPLTGLANRRALGERLRIEIARHTRARQRFAVLVLDLDGFKPINDRYGHASGDELLREVAGALTGAVRAQDAVARLGGDEFCVVAPQTGRDGAGRLAGRITSALAAVVAGPTGLSASAGAAVFPDDAHEPETLLAAADAAAIEAKRERRARRAA